MERRISSFWHRTVCNATASASELLTPILRYINQVSGSRQSQCPAKFRGGILADHMGLGKTLSMIALIALEKEILITRRETTENFIGPTLLVVPSSRTSYPVCYVPRLSQLTCLDSIERMGGSAHAVRPFPLSSRSTYFSLSDIYSHLLPNTLKWGRHYRKQRITNTSEFMSFDVVITTYQTITSEQRQLREDAPSVCSRHWNRIVLDEGLR